MPLYVPVIERIERVRSCYIYKLKPRRWFWRARLALWCELHLWSGIRDAVYWIATPEHAEQLCSDYRNWMGENRVGG